MREPARRASNVCFYARTVMLRYLRSASCHTILLVCRRLSFSRSFSESLRRPIHHYFSSKAFHAAPLCRWRSRYFAMIIITTDCYAERAERRRRESRKERCAGAAMMSLSPEPPAISHYARSAARHSRYLVPPAVIFVATMP